MSMSSHRNNKKVVISHFGYEGNRQTETVSILGKRGGGREGDRQPDN